MTSYSISLKLIQYDTSPQICVDRSGVFYYSDLVRAAWKAVVSKYRKVRLAPLETRNGVECNRVATRRSSGVVSQSSD